MNGVLVVDKPSGPTSQDVCAWFKKSLPVKKVGHAGTLDPLATGILVILLDDATRLQSAFMGGEKTYRFSARLGVETDTDDILGRIVREREPPPGTLNRLPAVVKGLTGEIEQIPPVYSAIKLNGTPLYKLARKGIAVQPKPRRITVYSFSIDEVNFPEIGFTVRCSSGTYVRSLARDLGRKLDCGATVTALRRLRSEPFGVEEAIVLPESFSKCGSDRPSSFRKPVRRLSARRVAG